MTPEEEHELYTPNVQYSGEEVKALARMLEQNDDDAAYVLGVLTAAMEQRCPERHTMDEAALRKIAMYDSQIEDVLRMRKKWLTEYPELMRNVEARW